MIKMTKQEDMSKVVSPVAPGKAVSKGLNPFDVLRFFLSNWLWFLLSLIVFVGWQWYRYATTQQVYRADASVMFKDARTSAQQARLDRLDNPLYQVNVSNEMLQFQMPQIMNESVWRLHAEVSYEVKDYLRIRELYSLTPVKVSFEDATQDYRCTFTIIVKDSATVYISNPEGSSAKWMSAGIGKLINSSYGKLRVTKTLHFSDDWYDRPIVVRKQDVSSVAKRLSRNLVINQAKASGESGQSSILNMSLSDVSPQRAADVLNMLITIYNEETIKDKNQAAINTSNFISERLTIIEKELGGVEQQIQEFKQANDMVDLGQTTSMSLGQREEFSSQARDLQMQQQMGQYIKDYLLDPQKETDLIPVNTGLADPSVEAQIAQYNAAKLRRDKLLEASSNKNPVVEDLNNSLNAMRQSIIRSVDNMNVSTAVKLRDISSRAGQARARVSAIPRQQRQMLSIERQQQIKQELYLYLLNKREENALSLAITESNARVIETAKSSGEPVEPVLQSMLLMGTLVGLALPAAILLFVMLFDTRIRSRRDIEDLTNVPFLGEIPKYTGAKVARGGVLLLDNTSDNAATEAFRIVRTNMTFMKVKTETLQVITVSSFGSGAGKTFVSSNLAASFAQTGKSVLLIDLDIRKGTLSHHLSKRKSKGVTSYLAGHVELDDIILKDSLCEHLDTIPAGPLAPNPAELLLSERLDQMIAQLRSRYDYIFIDNVPYGAIADATITNRIADLTIFIVRVGRLDRRMMPDLEKIYQSGQLNNMSLILNGVSLHQHGYGYGYGYGSKKKKHRPWWKKLKLKR